MTEPVDSHCMFKVRLGEDELVRAIAEYLEKRTYSDAKSVRNVFMTEESGNVFATAEVWKVPRP